MASPTSYSFQVVRAGMFVLNAYMVTTFIVWSVLCYEVFLLINKHLVNVFVVQKFNYIALSAY